MGATCSPLDCWRRLAARIVAVGVAACFCAAASGQTTWLVSNDPAENPVFPGLYEALQSPLVLNGDTIEVSEGIGMYYPPIDQPNVISNRVLTIRAEPGERPVLGVQTSTAFCCSAYGLLISGGSGLILDGFRILGGTQYVMSASGTPVLRNCLFVYGARDTAILTVGSPLFQNCEFRELTGQFGVTIQGGGARFEDCLFIDCVYANGGLVFGGGVSFTRCDFISNDSVGGALERLSLGGACWWTDAGSSTTPPRPEARV